MLLPFELTPLRNKYIRRADGSIVRRRTMKLKVFIVLAFLTLLFLHCLAVVR